VNPRNRHECKFVVPEDVAQHVLRRAAPFVAPDPFAQRSADHTYTIASLYFDDARRALYRETVEGLALRYKLRVRSYSDDPAVPVFVEIKRRLDRVVQKVRCPIARALLPDVVAGRAVAPDGASQAQLAALREFQRLLAQRRATPRAVVRYQRQAYVGFDDPELRVTVDRRLCALDTDEPAVRIEQPGFVAVPGRGVILELKFTDRMPPWMLGAVHACELRRDSYSKYCHALDALDARTRRGDAAAS
jgi:hypothetical protein